MVFTSTTSETAAVQLRNPRNLLKKPTTIAKGGSGKKMTSAAGRASSIDSGAAPRKTSAIEAEMVALFRPPGGKTSSPEVFSSTISPPGPGGVSSGDSSGSESEYEASDLGLDRDELAVKLDGIETAFMNAQMVASPNVCEADLVQMFDKTTMNSEPVDSIEYMENMAAAVVQDSVHCCAPTMIGHMTTSLPFYMRPLAKLLTTLHANNVKVETGKSTTFIEKEAIAMLHRHMFGMSDAFYAAESIRADNTLGVVCSGGTIANNTAMWIARNKALPADGEAYKGCDKQGLVKGLLHYKYEGAVIIGSEVMHYSMKKSADVLGIGIEGLLTCPFDGNYQVDVSAMRSHIEHCRANNICILSLVGVAGGTETGSIDDLNAIADLAKEFDLHFHVDAAWGGPVMFSELHKHKISGIERADTVTLDGHKQLYTPMGCGLCFLRDPNQIHSVQKTANYIIRKDSYDLGKFTMEGSRPAVSLFLHANLEIMGVKGYAALVDRSIRHVQYMVEALNATGQFEEALSPMTNILLYRYVPKALRGKAVLTADENAEVDRVNVLLQNAQKAAGSTFVSRTTIFSPKQQVRIVALRVVIANPLTNEAHIDATLADQLAIVAGIDC